VCCGGVVLELWIHYFDVLFWCVLFGWCGINLLVCRLGVLGVDAECACGLLAADIFIASCVVLLWRGLCLCVRQWFVRSRVVGVCIDNKLLLFVVFCCGCLFVSVVVAVAVAVWIGLV